jgi:sugar/nucleoside kinase (ribokinase family)
VGFPVDGQEAAAKASVELRQRGVGTVIVKLGAQGVFCATGARKRSLFQLSPVQAVDTVAAGDAFNGGLAAALAEGRSCGRLSRGGRRLVRFRQLKLGRSLLCLTGRRSMRFLKKGV